MKEMIKEYEKPYIKFVELKSQDVILTESIDFEGEDIEGEIILTTENPNS